MGRAKPQKSWKKWLLAALALVLAADAAVICLLLGLGDQEEPVQEEPSVQMTQAPQTRPETLPPETQPQGVQFQEPLIELLVRCVLNRPVGIITAGDCAAIDELRWYDLPDMTVQEREDLYIRSLEDLQYFPDLDFLAINDEPLLMDLSGLLYCPKLSAVVFSECPAVRLDALAQLTDLGMLSIDYAGIQDLTPLTQVHGLYAFYGAYASQGWDYDSNLALGAESLVDDILRANPSLQYVSVNTMQFRDQRVLLELPELTELWLYGDAEVDYRVVGQMTGLEALTIWLENEQRMPDLSFLKDLTNLKFLTLTGVEDPAQLVHLYHLDRLTELTLYDSPATENVEAMKALATALPGCEIGD